MLKCENLTFSQKDVRILQDVSLELSRGEIVSLLGPSGSGKTSLLRAVMGLNLPEGGTISFDDVVYSSDGQLNVPAEQRPFAFLFQDFTLFPHLSVEENILIGIKDLPAETQKERLDELSGLLNVVPLLKRSIHSLSGGEQQRIALARTLAIKPLVLLLDEPFSNLDKMTKTGLYHEVKSILRSENIAAILATHDQEEAFYFSDRLAVMSESRLLADAPPRELYDNPDSAWLAKFTGEAHVFTHDDLSKAFENLSDFNCGAGNWMVRPEDILVGPGAGWRIEELEYYGFFTRYVLKGHQGSISAVCVGSPAHEAGQEVSLTLKKSPIHLKT